jgi:hypothetical protein
MIVTPETTARTVFTAVAAARTVIAGPIGAGPVVTTRPTRTVITAIITRTIVTTETTGATVVTAVAAAIVVAMSATRAVVTSVLTAEAATSRVPTLRAFGPFFW